MNEKETLYNELNLNDDTKETILEFEGEEYKPEEVKKTLTQVIKAVAEEKAANQQMNEERAERLTNNIINENTIQPSMAPQEFADYITGVTKEENPNPITAESSMFNDLDNSNVSMDDDTKDAILQFEGEGYKPEEIKEALTDEEKAAYQQMEEERAERLANNIINENTIQPSMAPQEFADYITGVTKEENPNPITAENSMFNTVDPDENAKPRKINLSFDGIDKIEIRTKYSESDDIDLMKELDDVIKEISEREKAQNNPYKDLPSDKLDDMYLELYNYSSHYENGMENNEDTLKQLQYLKEEIDRRKNTSKYDNVSKEELQTLLNDLDGKIKEEYNYGSHNLNGMESSDNELENLIAEYNEVKDALGKKNAKKYDLSSLSNDELLQRRDELMDEYQFRAHEQNGMENNEDLVNRKANGREVFINDVKTNNDISMDDSAFKDGVYYNLDEIVEALEKEFSRIAPNETIVCNKTGEVVSKADLIEKVVNAAMEDNLVDLDPSKREIDYNAYGLKLKPKGQNQIDKGEVQTPNKDENGNDIPLAPNGLYVNGDTVKKILDDHDIVPAKTIPDLDQDEVDKLTAMYDRDMLDKFWGNKEKESRYKKGIAELKSHIITREDGTQYLENFEGREELEQFLQLEEYGPRLEAYSLYEVKGDDSLYRERIGFYKEIGMDLPLGPEGQELTEDELVASFIQDDLHYIETNNNAYNRLQSTYYNLQTLGKYGEKMPYFKMEHAAEDANFGERLSVAAKNVGHTVMNGGIVLKNYVSAPIHKIAGKYVVAPVYKLITKADERVAGLYSNKKSHRYQAALEYYQAEYMKKFVEDNEKRVAEGKKPKKFGGLFSNLKMLAVTRTQAMTKADEAYAKHLEAGHLDNKNRAAERTDLNAKTKKWKEKLEQEKTDLFAKEKELKQKFMNSTEEEKANINKQLVEISEKTRLIDRKINSSQTIGIKSNQNDATSMHIHDKTNKANVTHVVTAVETAAKVAGGVALKKGLYKVIREKQVSKYPDQTTYTSETNLTQEQLAGLTNSDVAKSSKSGDLWYTAYDNQPVQYVTGNGVNGEITGAVAPRQADGSVYSISNIASNSSIPHSTATLASAPGGGSSFFDTIAAASSLSGNKVTGADLINQIMNASDPQKAFVDFVNQCSLEVDGLGWIKDLQGSELLDLVTTTTKVPHVVEGLEYTYYTTTNVLDPSKLVGLGVLAATGADQIINEVRNTRGEEEMIDLDLRKGPAEEHRISTKDPIQTRNPENISEVGFTGKRQEDYDAWDQYNQTSVQSEGGRSR